eukprot:242762_1
MLMFWEASGFTTVTTPLTVKVRPGVPVSIRLPPMFIVPVLASVTDALLPKESRDLNIVAKLPVTVRSASRSKPGDLRSTFVALILPAPVTSPPSMLNWPKETSAFAIMKPPMTVMSAMVDLVAKVTLPPTRLNEPVMAPAPIVRVWPAAVRTPAPETPAAMFTFALPTVATKLPLGITNAFTNWSASNRVRFP